MFAHLHRALEDKFVGSVNADIGAESCAVRQDHLSSFTEISLISYLLLYCKRFFFWSAIRSQIILKFFFAFRYRNAYFFFQFYFGFSLLPPPNAHMAWQWIHSMAYKIKLCRSLCVTLGFQFVVDDVSW